MKVENGWQMSFLGLPGTEELQLFDFLFCEELELHAPGNLLFFKNTNISIFLNFDAPYIMSFLAFVETATCQF